MKVIWSIPNNCYMVMMGEEQIDLNGQRFFETIDDIKYVLKPKGLTVKNRLVIKSEPS